MDCYKFYKYLATIFLAFVFVLLLSTDCFAVDIFIDTVQNNDIVASVPDWVINNNYNYAYIVAVKKFNNRTPPNDKLYNYAFVVSDSTIILNSSHKLSSSSGNAFLSVVNGLIFSASDIASNISNLSYNYRPQTSVDISSMYDTANYPSVSAFTNSDILDGSGNVVYASNIITVIPPEITTDISDLQTLNFDYLSLATNGYYEDDVYLLVYDRSATGNDGLDALYPSKEILLNRTNYYQARISEQNAIYFIPIEDLRRDFYCW